MINYDARTTIVDAALTLIFILGRGSESLLVLIIKVANASRTDIDIPKSIFFDLQLQFWMRPEIVKPKMQNRRLDPMDPTKSGNTRWSMSTGPDFTCKEPVCQVFGQVGNQTFQFLQSKPGLLAG